MHLVNGVNFSGHGGHTAHGTYINRIGHRHPIGRLRVDLTLADPRYAFLLFWADLPKKHNDTKSHIKSPKSTTKHSPSSPNDCPYEGETNGHM
eukprot:4350226-Prymnesium_polylepis.1